MESVKRQSDLLPWHAEAWSRLSTQLFQDRLPHALLVTGPSGIGKGEFVEYLARSLLCERRGEAGRSCGLCQSCRWFSAQTHPDFRVLEPEEEGKPIRVDGIRGLAEALSLTSQCGGHQIGVIRPAHLMNPQAANSLLKTLEEPNLGTVLVLVSAQPSRLPATIRSRCQSILLVPPSAARARAWLEPRLKPGQALDVLLSLVGGGPLAALELAESDFFQNRKTMFQEWVAVAQHAEDPIITSARWLPWGLLPCVRWMQGWVADLLRLKASSSGSAVMNRDLIADLEVFARAVEAQKLFGYWKILLDTVRLQNSTLNPQLTLESLLIRWSELQLTH